VNLLAKEKALQHPLIIFPIISDPNGTWNNATDIGLLKGSSLWDGNNGRQHQSGDDIGKNYNYGNDSVDYYKFF
jgi:hypothetical protein